MGGPARNVNYEFPEKNYGIAQGGRGYGAPSVDEKDAHIGVVVCGRSAPTWAQKIIFKSRRPSGKNSLLMYTDMSKPSTTRRSCNTALLREGTSRGKAVGGTHCGKTISVGSQLDDAATVSVPPMPVYGHFRARGNRRLRGWGGRFEVSADVTPVYGRRFRRHDRRPAGGPDSLEEKPTNPT
jgi:hypothetical protein